MTTNYDLINTLSNIVLATIALLSLMLNFYLIYRERKNRIENVRARLYFSIADWNNKYMLKVSNVGKETAYHINLKVSGRPISENLYSFVIQVFDRLSDIVFSLEAGRSVYYLISPTERCGDEEGIKGIETHSGNEICEWLKKYEDEDIMVSGSYCDKYDIKETFSIREFLLYGSFEHKDALEEIADAFVSRNPSDKSIQKNIDVIAKAVKNK